LPAVAAVLLMRLVTDLDRSPELALVEVAVYALVTIAATWTLERPLLREVRGYLSRA